MYPVVIQGLFYGLRISSGIVARKKSAEIRTVQFGGCPRVKFLVQRQRVIDIVVVGGQGE